MSHVFCYVINNSLIIYTFIISFALESLSLSNLMENFIDLKGLGIFLCIVNKDFCFTLIGRGQ